MRRRREDILRDDVKDVILSKGKGLLGWVIRGLLTALVDAVIKMLVNKGWVSGMDEFEDIP